MPAYKTKESGVLDTDRKKDETAFSTAEAPERYRNWQTSTWRPAPGADAADMRPHQRTSSFMCAGVAKADARHSPKEVHSTAE